MKSCGALFLKSITGKGQQGFALLDALLAMAILGVTAAAFLGAVASAEKAVYVSDERTMAESLVRRQLEAVKESGYINYSVIGHSVYSAISPPASYSVGVTAAPIDPATLQALPAGEDQGIQDIEVNVERNGRTVLAVHDFKVAR